MTVGRVASWRSTKGWGTLWTPELPGKVWAHFGDVVEMGELARGEYVAFEFEEVAQDSYSYRATWVRRLDGADTGQARDYLREVARWRETGIGPRPETPLGLDHPPPQVSSSSDGAYGSTLAVSITYQYPSIVDGER